MDTLVEIMVALLAAGGLLALGWLFFGRLLVPVGGKEGGTVYAVIPASGDAETLEHDVACLLWLRGGGLAKFTIVVADLGLSETGSAIAQVLLEREDLLAVCPPEHLSTLLQQTEPS